MKIITLILNLLHSIVYKIPKLKIMINDKKKNIVEVEDVEDTMQFSLSLQLLPVLLLDYENIKNNVFNDDETNQSFFLKNKECSIITPQEHSKTSRPKTSIFIPSSIRDYLKNINKDMILNNINDDDDYGHYVFIN